MSLEHLGHPDNRPKTTPHTPCIPLVEELLGARGVDVLPEPAELLFDRPRPGCLQSVVPDCLEASPLLRRQVRLVEEPELPRSFETVIVLGLEGLVLGPPDLIDRLSEMLGDVELVMHQLVVRKLLRHSIGIGRKHVGGDRPNLLSLLNRQRLEDGLGSRLGAFRDHVKNTGAVEISENGDVVMPLPEALLVDAQVGNVRRLPTLQAPCDRAIHDGLHSIPGEAE